MFLDEGVHQMYLLLVSKVREEGDAVKEELNLADTLLGRQLDIRSEI